VRASAAINFGGISSGITSGVTSILGATGAKPEWLSDRQSPRLYKTRAGSYRYAYRLVLLTRVPRRAFGSGGGPSPLETGCALIHHLSST
jgi:hypothetical protein